MQKKVWMVVALLLVMPGLLFTVSCQKRVQAQAPAPAPVAPAPAPTPPPPAPAPAKLEVPAFMTERIFFDFDKSVLKPDSQALLKKKADWLKANPAAKMLIEGNTDERGTAEYNLALGERRAEAAKKFLVDMGIDAKRISTISYGEERPIDPRRNEEAWAKNRNDGFVVN